MRKYYILAAVISMVTASPLPDFASQEQQQWSDTTTPSLLSTQPNDELLASNSQLDAQTGFEETNVVVPSMPFAMDIHQVAVGGGDPSIFLSNEVINPSTSFDVGTTNLLSSSTIPRPDPGLTPASSRLPGSDTTNTGTGPAANSTPNSSPSTTSSSLTPMAALPGSEVPILGSTPDSSPSPLAVAPTVPEVPVPGSTPDSFSSPSAAAPTGSEVPVPGSTPDYFSSPPAPAPTGSEIPVPGSTPNSFSSTPTAAPPNSEVPASGSTQEQAPLDINSIFEPPILDEAKRYAAFECGASASVCCQLGLGSQATATPKALSCSNKTQNTGAGFLDNQENYCYAPAYYYDCAEFWNYFNINTGLECFTDCPQPSS